MLSKESVISQRSPELDNQESELLTPTTPTTSKIKAITLHQPWASLVGKYKHYETRGKATNYRGKIAIHAAIRQETTDYQVNELADLLVGEEISFGSIVAIADLSDCIKMTEEFISQQSATELRCGLWEVGRYAWKLENVEILDEPIPARGMPGMWDIEIPCSLFPIPSSELPITKPQFKTGEYILNGRVGEIIEASPGEYFSVKYGNSHTDLKCYFWGQDDELIDQLAIAKRSEGIAPQELVKKFLEENSTTEKFLEENSTTEKFLEENSTTEKFLEENSTTEKFLEETLTTEKFLEETLTTEKFLEETLTTEK
ncbi:ASCH domain-containing protein, partial [Dolichospermum circinale]|uniref:ASCH domain-containing protein n=1 Tax=Dolichospermum circinale TaxID=109265 RepID=UPI00232C9B3A